MHRSIGIHAWDSGTQPQSTRSNPWKTGTHLGAPSLKARALPRTPGASAFIPGAPARTPGAPAFTPRAPARTPGALAVIPAAPTRIPRALAFTPRAAAFTLGALAFTPQGTGRTPSTVTLGTKTITKKESLVIGMPTSGAVRPQSGACTDDSPDHAARPFGSHRRRLGASTQLASGIGGGIASEGAPPFRGQAEQSILPINSSKYFALSSVTSTESHGNANANAKPVRLSICAL